MHNHISYLHGRPRLIQRHVVGNVSERKLEELWMDPEYVAYRDECRALTLRRAPSAAGVSSPRRTRRTAWGTRCRRAAAVCGRRRDPVPMRLNSEECSHA